MNLSKNGTLVAKSCDALNIFLANSFPHGNTEIDHFQIDCINESRSYNEASGSFEFIKNGILVKKPQIAIFKHNWTFEGYVNSRVQTIFEISVK
jgi:hypothetical protein